MSEQPALPDPSEEALQKARNSAFAASVDQLRDLATTAKVLADEHGNVVNSLYAQCLLAMVKRREGQVAQSIRDLQKILARARATKDNRLMGVAYSHLATSHGHSNNAVAAIRYFNKALQHFDQINDKLYRISSLIGLASAYELSDLFHQAIEHLHEALEVAEELNSDLHRCMVIEQLGVVFGKIGEYETAEKHLENAEELYAKIGNRNPGQLLMNRGVTARNLDRNDDALELYHKALKYIEDSGNRKLHCDCLNNIGEIYQGMGQPDKSLDFYLQARAMADEIDNIAGKIHALTGIGAALLDLGSPHPDHGSALDVFAEALRLADGTSSVLTISNIHEYIANAYEREDNPAKAFEHMHIAIELAKKIFADPSTKKILTEEARSYSRKLQKKHRETEQRSKELLELNFALLQASDFKTRMVAMASQDLKQPLAVILSECAGLVAADLSESALEHVEEIQGLAGTMLDLVGNLLDSSDLELGRIEVLAEPCELRNLVETTVSKFRLLAREKRQNIQIDNSGKVVALADRRLVVQILDNLLSNALKYSPSGSEVRVRVAHTLTHALISVSDQGPGFNEADRLSLFEKFSRLSAIPTGNESSHGLGLSTVKHLVDLLKAEITLDSAPGEGATFTILLPLFTDTASI